MEGGGEGEGEKRGGGGGNNIVANCRAMAFKNKYPTPTTQSLRGGRKAGSTRVYRLALCKVHSFLQAFPPWEESPTVLSCSGISLNQLSPSKSPFPGRIPSQAKYVVHSPMNHIKE